MSKTPGYIVLYDDDVGLCVPYGWDAACEGALCAIGRNDPIAIFEDRKAAQRAIRISAAYAKLCQEQGKPPNDDFLGHRDNIRIVQVRDQP